MLAIINAELVMRDHLIPEAVLFVEGGIITGFGEMRSTPIPEGCEVIDAKGAYVGPGLVDIHCHAGDGLRYHQDPIHAATYHLKHGTTTVLATTGTRMPLQEYLDAVDLIRSAMSQPGGKSIGGIIRSGDCFKSKKGLHHKLHLLLFCTAIACDCHFDLVGCIFKNFIAQKFVAGEQNHTSCLCNCNACCDIF